LSYLLYFGFFIFLFGRSVGQQAARLRYATGSLFAHTSTPFGRFGTPAFGGRPSHRYRAHLPHILQN
jgi:hypothetical protein